MIRGSQLNRFPPNEIDRQCLLSFFISNWKEDMTDFKRMYGKDSVSIDPTSLVSLAKVLNKKFLEN